MKRKSEDQTLVEEARVAGVLYFSYIKGERPPSYSAFLQCEDGRRQ